MNLKRRRKVYARLWEAQAGQCCYCRTRMIQDPTIDNGKAMSIEHLRRKCDGGTDRWGNIALACRACNSGRGSTDWLTYASMKQGELAA